MPQQSAIPVTEASQVGEARRVASRLAESAGLDATRRGEVAIVATELANNLARYARGGKLLVQAIPAASPEAAILEIITVDSGPGIADVGRCLQDGFSTGGTSGTGLGAVRRLASEFDIYSTHGTGTAVVARLSGRSRAAGTSAPYAKPPPFQWTAVSVPAPHETVCGDAWRVIQRGQEIRLLVADGLGHGPSAAEASELAARLFEEDAAASPDTDVAVLVERAHRQLSGTRGAALAIAAGSALSRSLRYAGVGNIAGALVGASDSRGLFSHNGTVGHQMRKAQALDYPWPEGTLLIMHSDGLQSRWRLGDYPGLVTRHPAIIAAVLYRDFVRGRDDATVVVARLGEAQA